MKRREDFDDNPVMGLPWVEKGDKTPDRPEVAEIPPIQAPEVPPL